MFLTGSNVVQVHVCCFICLFVLLLLLSDFLPMAKASLRLVPRRRTLHVDGAWLQVVASHHVVEHMNEMESVAQQSDCCAFLGRDVGFPDLDKCLVKESLSFTLDQDKSASFVHQAR